MTTPDGGAAPGAQPTAPAPTAAAPAPGAPAAPPATPAPQPGQDPNAPVDVASLPPNVQQMIKNLNKEAGGHRQTATAAKQQLDAVLKALGVNADGTPAADPETVAAEFKARAEAAEGQAWAAGVRLEIHRLAPKLGGDPDALLDSQSFQDMLDDLVDVDPNSAVFRTALEAKIREAVEAKPSLRAATSVPARLGADITGSGGGATGRSQNLEAALARKLAGGS